jgi:glycosyltransferase involved in cell wall biosynthesis
MAPSSAERHALDEGSNESRIAILLATYNGEKYLDEQIRSLFAQTYHDFVIIARDDNSRDRTPDILARWAAERPERFTLVADGLGNLGFLGNFSRLMELCDAPYFAFCDQDDVWLPHKIERLMNEVRRLEREFGASTPILVHSDVRLVDATLREIAPSFFRHMQIEAAVGRRLDRLIVKNIVTGCASMGNRALLTLACPIPAALPYHDWWLALIAASCGELRTIPDVTVLYRQHGRNEAGAGDFRPRTLWGARHILQQPKKLRERVARVMAIVQPQARFLLERFGPRMPPRSRDFLRAFCAPARGGHAASLPWIQRTRLLTKSTLIYARLMPYVVVHWCQ